MDIESSSQRGCDSGEVEEIGALRIVKAPTSYPYPKFQFQTPNWGDNPSPRGLNLMNLALKKFNQDWAKLVEDNPGTYASVQLAFVGGLHINSFVNDGVWCHLNFRTKKVDPVDTVFEEHGPYLFFAEVKRPHLNPKYIIKSVCNIGPAKYVQTSKLGTCKACDVARHRHLMMHPTKGFNVGYTPQYDGADVIPTGQDQGQGQDQDDLMREREAILALQRDINNDDTTVLYGELPDHLAKLSLLYYNEAATNNQEPEHKLVRNKCCATFVFSGVGIRWYHINFIACSATNAEGMLFFAEVRSVCHTRGVEVVHCDILGPATHVAPRLDGCVGCDRTSVRTEIAHPINGGKSRGEFLIK